MTGPLVQFVHLSFAYTQYILAKTVSILRFFFFLSSSSFLYRTDLPHAPFFAIITTGTPCCFITMISELSAGLLVITIQTPPPTPSTSSPSTLHPLLSACAIA